MKAKEEGNFEQVLKSLSKSMGLRSDPVYHVERAEAYIQLCDFQSAILNYKKACLMDPDNAEYYSRLAFLYYFMGQTLFDQRLYPEALESFARAAEMNPDNTGYHIRRYNINSFLTSVFKIVLPHHEICVCHEMTVILKLNI